MINNQCYIFVLIGYRSFSCIAHSWEPAVNNARGNDVRGCAVDPRELPSREGDGRFAEATIEKDYHNQLIM